MVKGVVRPANINDIHQIAFIHKSEFQTHFLGKYSIKLLEKFYANFLDKNIVLVNENSGVIVGFILGGTSKSLNLAKSQFIKNNKGRCLLETLLRPQLYTSALIRILKTVTVNQKSEEVPAMETIRLLSIAVTPNVKGTGIAERLLKEFERIILSSREYGLSIKKSNKRALNFYFKNGFQLERETHDDIYLIKKIDSAKGI